jgi:hypothetical protein
LSKVLFGRQNIPLIVVSLRSTWGLELSFVLLLLISIALAMVTWGENTPPEVQVQTPVEGASLGLTVTVSGKATDAEGFNVESYVEARWNDWEWFSTPITPADGNSSIVFGELVNLDWHSPGEHLLQVRAYDGELYSQVAEVNVTVRDLPDVVILPNDINIEPAEPREGDDATLTVVVHNQGGEDVPDVEVVLYQNGEELDSQVIDMVEARSEARPSFRIAPKEGDNTYKVTAHPLGQVEERTSANNLAERSFTVGGPATAEDGWGMSTMVRGGLILVASIALVVVYIYAVVASRKH